MQTLILKVFEKQFIEILKTISTERTGYWLGWPSKKNPTMKEMVKLN